MQGVVLAACGCAKARQGRLHRKLGTVRKQAIWILGRALPERQDPVPRPHSGSSGQDQSVRPHHAVLTGQEVCLPGFWLIPIFCTLDVNELQASKFYLHR